VTRKNAGGSHNGNTAGNAARVFTVTATAKMAGLNTLTYLTAYLDECGRNGGKPLTGKALERGYTGYISKFLYRRRCLALESPATQD
jgi:transposase